ncbi:MAG: hypothetical protein KKC64_02670 [Spirochaetes bacterium]|nr:hypothetical protein [Spirochaetota bacterium]
MTKYSRPARIGASTISAIFILLLFPALLAFAISLQRNFRDGAVQEIQRSLSAVQYQSDRLVLDIDLELSFIDTLLGEALAEQIDQGDQYGLGGGHLDVAAYQLNARWPEVLQAAYIVEQNAKRWTVQQVFGTATPLSSSIKILELVEPYASAGISAEASTILDSRGNSLLFRVNSLGPGPALRFMVTLFDETALLSRMLPELSDRYFGRESGFDMYTLAVYRPDGSLAFSYGEQQDLPRQLSSLPDANTPEPIQAALPAPDFSRPLFRDPGRFDLSSFYIRTAAAQARPIRPAGSPDAETAHPAEDSLTGLQERLLRIAATRLIPDYIEQYRFFTRTVQNAWQLTVYREGLSIPQQAIRTARLNGFGAYLLLAIIYAAVVVLYVSLRRTAALAERERSFFASVSHELKTPIAVIQSAGDNLAKGIVDSGRIPDYGEVLAKEARRLGSTVERLLLVAGLQAGGRMHHEEPQSLVRLVQTVAARYSPEDCITITPAVSTAPAAEPLVSGSAAEPLVSGSAAEPLVSGSAAEPLVSGSAAEPLVSGSAAEPLVSGSAAEPLVSGSAAEPLVSGSAAEPLVSGSAAEPLVSGSALLLEAAVDSVLSNAVKYGRPPIELSIFEVKRGGRRYAIFRCLDHGGGIPRKERHKLFEPFYRGSAARQSRQNGTGIGLYLARRVARLHGGDARLVNNPGGGTIMELSFRAYP